MTDKRKKWQCPSCPYRASRRGNMKVHISRWHNGNEEPIYLGEQSEYLLRSKKVNQRRPNSRYNNVNPVPDSFQIPSSKEPDSPFQYIKSFYNNILEVNEIKAKIASIKNFNNGNLFWYPPLNTNLSSYRFSPGYYGKTFVPPFMQSLPISIANMESSSFIASPAVDSQQSKREELVGFKGRICENCGDVIIEAHYEVEDIGNDLRITARNEHVCLFPLKKALRENEMARLITNLSANLMRLPWELKKAVKEWTGQETFLTAFKLPSDKVNTEDIIDIFVPPRAITIPYYEETSNEWALGVRKNGSITLGDNDLIAFIMIAKNKTWGYFRIHLDALKANKDVSNSGSETYCMFINKHPLPTPGQQILEFSPEQSQQVTPLLQELHQLIPLLEQQLGQVLPEKRRQMIQLIQRQFHLEMGQLEPRQRQYLLEILPQRLQQILLSIP